MKAAKSPIPILSLFSGAGGLDLGFGQAGFQTVLALDKDRAATATFNANFQNQVAKHEDLAAVDAAAIIQWLKAGNAAPRGVIGGPPCQGFSLSNMRAQPDDPRNLLPFRYCEIISALREQYEIDFFVFENVLGLRSPKHRERLQEIVAKFEAAGFDVVKGELDAQHFGVAQQRRRLFLVGTNRQRHPGFQFQWPKERPDKIRTVRQVIGGLPEPAYWKKGLSPGEIGYHQNHWTSPPRSWRFEQQAFNGSCGRSFRRLDWDLPSWTVAYGNREIHIHPDGKRRLSILEAMLLQSFPKKFVILGNCCEQVRQVSNAVPPRVARVVAAALRKQLFR